MPLPEMLEGYAEVCRAVQRKAIELENHPDRDKQLRRFSAREVADILLISAGHLRNLVRETSFPQGVTAGNGRRSFSVDEIHAARQWLLESTGQSRYAPRRRPERGEAIQILTFVNFKGGSGKTTTATHFAQHMALIGYRVLMIDLDPQASATALFGLAPESDIDVGATFAGWIRREGDDVGTAQALRRRTYWPNLDLIAANIGLQHAEYELVGNLFGNRTYPFYGQLRGLIAHLEADYDVVVCDCRPDVGMLTINALIAATGLVIPIPPSMIDFASSGEFFRFLAEVVRDFRRTVAADAMSYRFVRVVTTKFRPADRNQSEIVAWKHAFFKDAVLKSPMLETASIDAAGILRETLYEYEPSSDRRTFERGLEAMRQVNGELEAEIRAAWHRDATSQAEAT